MLSIQAHESYEFVNKTGDSAILAFHVSAAAAIPSASETVFLDDIKISLGPNTWLTLDRSEFDPDPGRGKFAMTTI